MSQLRSLDMYTVMRFRLGAIAPRSQACKCDIYTRNGYRY